MMKSILMTAGVALVGVVIGAIGYAFFFGPKSKGSSSEGSQSKSDSSSKKESGTKRSWALAKARRQARCPGPGINQQLDPPPWTAEDADLLKKQIKELSQRVDQFRERLTV